MNSESNVGEDESGSDTQNNNDYQSMTYIDSNLTLATYNEHLIKLNTQTLTTVDVVDTTLTTKNDDTTQNNNLKNIITQDNNTIVTLESVAPPPQSLISGLIERKKKYKNREEILKNEYYKSNPLRNYAPTRGQTILPHNFVFQSLKQASYGNISEQGDTAASIDSQSENNSNQFVTSYKNKKKSLPKVYKDLRITRDIEEDRDLHRQKLRTILKLNLTQFKKSPIDLLENSKKVYSEYCRNNLEKPLDLANVESVLKNVINSRGSAKLQNKSEKKTKAREESEEDDSSIDDDYESFRGISKHYVYHHRRKKIDTNFLIDAQTLSIKGIEEMSKEIKDRKAKLAKMDLNNESSLKHIYRTVKSSESTEANPIINDIENIENHFNKHKGSIYNYRLASKIASKQSASHRNNFYNNVENGGNDGEQHIHTNSDIDTDSIIQHQQQHEAQRLMQARSMILFADDEKEQLTKRREQYKQRIANARSKILCDPAIKNNLNKMTILQPFEDTKILINIDKVPSKILNSLLNKQNTAPRYYMPPVRAFGYFRNVISTKTGKAIENIQSMFTPGSSRASANVNRHYSSNEGNYSRSPKLKKHFTNQNSSNNNTGNANNNSNSMNPMRSSSQRSIKYESLQTLSQIPAPFYGSNNRMNTSIEAVKNGKNKSNDDDTSSLKQAHSTNLTGISIK